MGCKPPSRTTAPDRPPGSYRAVGARARLARRCHGRTCPALGCRTPRLDAIVLGRPEAHVPPRRRPAFFDAPFPHISFVAALLVSALLVFTAWSVAGCTKDATPLARSGDRLESDIALSADLDGDGVAEQVLVEGVSRRLIIGDGENVYRSREKWQVAEAFLGDTDGNALLEVVTLLDDVDGRHLGLFAYMGDEYRERLVTSVLSPRPLSLLVVTDRDAAGSAAGDLIVLTEESDSSESGVQSTTYRWNGFGFTALRPSARF